MAGPPASLPSSPESADKSPKQASTPPPGLEVGLGTQLERGGG